MEKNNKKIKYKPFSMRLNKKTIKALTKGKLKFGKSWNLYIYELYKHGQKVINKNDKLQ